MNTFSDSIAEKSKKKGGMELAINTIKRGENMKRTLSGAAIALAFVCGIMATTSTTANAQWRNGNYSYNQQQLQQGYQYGVTTGSSDAQRRQSYRPQRSHYFREARTQAFRDGFVRGYDRGFSQYSASAGYGYGRPNGGYRNDGYPRGGYSNQELSRGYEQGINT